VYVPLHKSRRRQKEGVERMAVATVRNAQAVLLHRWRAFSRQGRKISRCAEIVTRRANMAYNRRIFIQWRCRWMSVLFWRERELKVC
jgi:hypothetical protein